MKQPGDKIRVSTWDGKTVIGTVVRAEDGLGTITRPKMVSTTGVTRIKSNEVHHS